jgi:putative oxidoreductase
LDLLTYKREPLLQRLFSTFAKGWPGMGLLCLRLGTGIVLFHDGVVGSVESPHQQHFLGLLIEAAAGLFLCAGLWTPIAGGATAIIGLWGAFSRPADLWSQLQLAILGAGLAMLGPGAWSVDARLFGRKRINIPDR